MVIIVEIENYVVKKVLVDQGSSVDILYWATYQKLQLLNTAMVPYDEPIYGFSGEKVSIRDYIDLHTVFRDVAQTKTIPIRFVIVDAPTSYNVLLGRPSLNTLSAVVSTPHLAMKNHPLELPSGCTIKLDTELESEQRDIITPTIFHNSDLFAWSAADLPGVDPQVASHKLSIYKEAQYVSQKKCKLGEERRLAAMAEADKLLSAGFIEEAHYTTWLSNVVLVKKANGKWRMCVDYTDVNKACPRDAYPLPNID
ncbi:uncharacterized protein LOC114170300 [Vigna unguiculata]|uniref:uncharacterized protein LOC114170300 n=1 Tax=Vigna unguiculata TaxID=3917 RepID=UPI001016690E|nr:uncharacterized protein LOC114170300 [Vigna unguiculata]